MKKNVIIYVRVSTDEQAEKGFSIRSQIEKLKKHCYLKDWNVLIVFQEDFSAWKGFDRPEYLKLRQFIKKSKEKVDYILFTQWSRFSRNAAESSQEIERLRAMKIEANAIQQWIDFKIPENLYTLQMYLAAPQVENDRLSLRVKDAIRRGLKEGKWMGRAPYGYLNDKLARSVIPDANTSSLVTFAFQTFATDAYSIVEVRRMAEAKGMSIKKQQFINMLSNCFYNGKIYIKSNDDDEEEEATYIKGIHQALIDDETFETVQAILRRKTKPYKGNTKKTELPLKGFLICPNCNRLMTGSASRSRNGTHHHYYHCQRKYGCHNSYAAIAANSHFEKYLDSFKVSPDVLSLFFKILEDIFKTNDTKRGIEGKKLTLELKNVGLAIQGLDDKMVKGDLPIGRYNRLIDPLEQKKDQLKIQILELSKSNNEMKQYLDFSLSLLTDVRKYYQQATIGTKQKIIGSIFPENFVFDGTSYRTTKLNEVFDLIASSGKAFNNKQPGQKTELSTLAPAAGLEPATL